MQVENYDKIFVGEKAYIRQDCILILHRLVELMYNDKRICQIFLQSKFKVVYATIVLEYFLNGTTITQSIKFSTQNIFASCRDSLAFASYFPYKGVTIPLVGYIIARLEKIGRNRDSQRVRSINHFPVISKLLMAVREARESFDYRSIYFIPSADQSILREMGLELTYLMKRGEVTELVLHSCNSWMEDGVYPMI